MTDIILCFGMILVLLILYVIFGKAASRIFKLQFENDVCLIFGAFVYYGMFQVLAVPLIFLKQPLSRLMFLWIAVVAIVVTGCLWTERRSLRRAFGPGNIIGRITAVKVIMLVLVMLQMYYMITSEYLGWDTAAYVGTVETSAVRDSMYLYQGESGKAIGSIELRYALSGFYMHSAVWCRLLRIRALYFAKIVQGGILAVLASLTIFRLGRFFFSGASYRERIPEEKVSDCACGVVIACIIINVFFDSMYSTSDFLLARAMEAKAYCANFVLPCILLFGLMLWREGQKREPKAALFAVLCSSVAVSMSSLVIAPAMVTILLLPMLRKWKTGAWIRYYLLCVLPNGFYLILYLLYKAGIFVIGV